MLDSPLAAGDTSATYGSPTHTNQASGSKALEAI